MKGRRPLLLSIMFILVAAARGTAQGPPEVPDTHLEASAKEFVQLLSKGQYERAAKNFDDVMTRVMPPAKLEEVWKKIAEAVGPFQSQRRSRMEKVAKYDVVYVTCDFEKLAVDIKVVFDSKGKITGLFFQRAQLATDYSPPSYAELDSFRESELTIGTAPWTLPATLTLPKDRGPFPCVVLVHGSGPRDRDETVGANKPFKDLAWGLATRGIAVLRYDKRTYAHRAAMAQSARSLTVKEEVIDDVFTAVGAMKQHPAIDPDRIFVLGHSLAGYLAPRMALRDRDGSLIAGYVILAGNTRPTEELLWDQTNYISRLDGSVSEAEAKQLEGLKKRIERVRDPGLSKDVPPGELLGAPASYWLDLQGYRPAALAAELSQPMLILQGERDYQVTMKDFEGWARALSSRDNVVLKSYPKSNHLFIEGEGLSTPAEYQVAGHVAQEVIDDIASWIKGH
ncbi:MAG TPA: alpha/beta fold hydrolase [Planctomycetaceae bacterium]|nr:alpha/beta fold hydrolase [Planctomycetaceae bacterium]